MNDTRGFRLLLNRLGRILLAVLLFPLAFGQKLLLSARAWVLFILLIVVVLVVYYVLADLYTPFTTDAYVQAYVVQVAPRVEGQVVRVCVHENQAVSKGDLLFEIDRRPFEHRCAIACCDIAQLRAALQPRSHAHRVEGKAVAGAGKPRVVLMFPGAGAHYPGAGRELLDQPAFAQAVDECFALMPAEAPNDLRAVMFGGAHKDFPSTDPGIARRYSRTVTGSYGKRL